MAEVGKNYLFQLLCLLADGGRNRWFGMTVQCHPPAADGIDQLSAVTELEQATAGTPHWQWHWTGCHLGCGMPEVGVPVDGAHQAQEECR
jgi:hypothetical protein